MAMHSGNGHDESFKAGADQSAKQFYIVKYSAANTVIICSAAADRAIGVLRNKPKSGEAATVRITGIAEVLSDGSGTAIAVNDYVGPNSSAKAVKKATADYSVLGIALDASSTDGAIIRVLLTPGAWWRSSAG